MSLFSGLQDRLTALFISDEDKATARQVQRGQQAILDRQHDEGVITDDRYDELSGAVDDAGSYLEEEDDRLGESSLTPDLSDLGAPFKLIPTWLIVAGAVAVVALIYFWFQAQKRGAKTSLQFGKSLLPALLKH